MREINSGTLVGQPLPWIIGIARHKLLDHLRRARTAHLFVIVSPARLVPETNDEPSSFEVERRDQVLAALAAVPSPQRDALILHYMDGLPVAEIAVALGRSRSAAESLLARARTEFRTQYLELDNDD